MTMNSALQYLGQYYLDSQIKSIVYGSFQVQITSNQAVLRPDPVNLLI